eukprot:2843603-Alexandrium_andersonii.AAC.1
MRGSRCDRTTWDVAASIRARAKLEERQRRMHRVVASGAVWRDLYAHRAGYSSTPKCSKCNLGE